METHLQTLIAYLSAHPHIAMAAIFAAAFLEALALIGTVIPGSSVVFAGGVLVGLGALDPWVTAVVAVAGAILGDGVSYTLGRRYHQHIRAMWPMKNHPDVFARGEAYFAKNGGKSVFFGRFLGPVRAIVPVVAGMSNMPRAQFYTMNVLSAFAWAGIHIAPGVLFGASLKLAGAVSSRLLVLLLAIALALWAISRVVRFLFARGRPHVRSLRDRVVARARKHPGLPARFALSLLDPERPESPGLLIGAILLIGSAWVFLGILEDVVFGDPLVQLDQSVFSALQTLRTGWADDVMVTITGLGGAAGSLPVIVTVALLLAFRRYWRTLAYWLATVGFAQVFVWMLKAVLGRARPHNIYTGFEQFSFPSGHAASSIVVYGFLTFLLCRGRTRAVKSVITSVAAAAILLVALSRLYLGVHWFSDVAASLSFGLAWVALLGIAYTHHVRDERVSAGPLLLVVLATLTLVGAPYVSFHHAAEMKRYFYRPAPQTITLQEWTADGWRALPAGRSELAGEIEEPFAVQWRGASTQIVSTLSSRGWKIPPAWSARTALLWLLPSPAMADLPVLPKFHRGEMQKLTLVKNLDAAERVVLRLWPLRQVLDATSAGTARPLWAGSVTSERLAHPLGLVTLTTMTADSVTPVRILEQDIASQGLPIERRHRNGSDVVLAW